MLSLEKIAEGLADRRLDVVAKATGVSRSTISRIRRGENVNPTIKVIKALSDYLAGGR
jgi:transcriptional regulator with XRE-family HTH domain